MNQSQVESPRFWVKWRKAGAVGTMLDAITQPIRKTALPIDAIAIHDPNNVQGKGVFSTLSIGQQLVHEGPHFKVFKPVLAVVVPGSNFELGQMVKAKDLPPGTTTIKDYLKRK
jgi:hypothetical protein